jgi:hypothetical protein
LWFLVQYFEAQESILFATLILLTSSFLSFITLSILLKDNEVITSMSDGLRNALPVGHREAEAS